MFQREFILSVNLTDPKLIFQRFFWWVWKLMDQCLSVAARLAKMLPKKWFLSIPTFVADTKRS
jgi:hypothetical protein